MWGVVVGGGRGSFGRWMKGEVGRVYNEIVEGLIES
jgi:hypothetical protein